MTSLSSDIINQTMIKKKNLVLTQKKGEPHSAHGHCTDTHEVRHIFERERERDHR